jgi:hypothetical protein
VALIVMAGKPQDAAPEPLPVPSASTVPSLSAVKEVTPPVPPLATGPRRMKVAGREGYWVVILQDGSSYLEGPDGKKETLAEAGPALVTPKPKVTLPAPLKPVGQLVVCDDGVVDVPLGAVITLIGKDKVVTHTEDGSSVVYYTDGRVEQRGRPERTEVGKKP